MFKIVRGGEGFPPPPLIFSPFPNKLQPILTMPGAAAPGPPPEKIEKIHFFNLKYLLGV